LLMNRIFPDRLLQFKNFEIKSICK
jgi:hypothetical protein